MQNRWIISYTETILMNDWDEDIEFYKSMYSKKKPYSVHQHWDPLKVCAVGRSYPPEFYSYIDNAKVRTQFEQIAQETEEDYQSLIKILQSFNVEVVRTEVYDDFDRYLAMPNSKKPKYRNPMMMTPRDWCTMIGNKFYAPKTDMSQHIWTTVRGPNWPILYPGWNKLEDWIQKELVELHGLCQNDFSIARYWFGHEHILKKVQDQNNVIQHTQGEINSAMMTRVGKDLYWGTEDLRVWAEESKLELLKRRNSQFPEYRNHIVDSQGHADGVYCPVKPGLIVSLIGIQQYSKTFPDWEVVYLPNQSWGKVLPFMEHKNKVNGKWWVPGAELNDDFTEYVESWMSHWVGYVEESVFDVNMLVIDEQNVICNNENDAVFRAFEKHGITPHVCNFRHRYFWDGGIHCITQDLHREGEQKDYFPNRG